MHRPAGVARVGLGALVLAAGLSLPSRSAEAPATATTPQYGINTYLSYHCQRYVTYLDWTSTQLEAFKALGANAVALAFPLYTPSITSDSVYPALNCKTAKFQTPPTKLLAEVVAQAHALGLHVLLRPLVDETALYRESSRYWRGLLAPKSIVKWVASYDEALRPYLVMAQSTHVEHFALESELDSIAIRSSFRSVITYAKTLYRGDLAIDYTWSFAQKRAWAYGTSFAIDTYPPIPDTSFTQTVAQVEAQWNTYLRTWAKYKLPKVTTDVIDEIGIAAQEGAYQQPYTGSFPLTTHPFNQQIQATWFAAACAFMKKNHLQGIYYWGPWATSSNGKLATVPDEKHPSFLQPATQRAIAACFGK